MSSKGDSPLFASAARQPGPGRPLAGTERAFYAVSQLSPLNLVVLVRLAGPALDGLLPQALAALQQRHPLLRARIAGRPSQPRFEVSPAGADPDGTGPIPVRLLHGGDADSALAVVDEELSTPFDPSTGPLARLTCMSGSGQGCDLVLTLHHAIADGASAASLVHELLDWCRARIAGDAAPLPVPATVPPPLTEVLPDGQRGFRGQRHALMFLVRQGSDEIAYRAGSRGRRPIPPPGRAVARSFSLDRDRTARLVDTARRQRLTLTSLLSAALLLQASAVLYGGRPRTMRAIVWADLRPHLNPPVGSETLGCYVSMLRFAIRVDPGQGLDALAAQVQDRIRQAAGRGDLVPAALLSARLARIPARWAGRLGTTALSYAALPGIYQSYGALDVRELRGFVSNVRFGTELAAAAGVAQGMLWCNLLYLESDLGPEAAAAVANGLLCILTEFAAA